MFFEKATLTLYDFFGYLLPGFVVLAAIAIAESTFLQGSLLSLQTVQDHWFFFGICAYYLGHIAQAIGGQLQRRLYSWMTTREGRLGVLYTKAKERVKERLQFSDEEMIQVHTREVFLICDAYTVTSKAALERDMLIGREGFYRGSFVGFLILFLVVTFATFAGGIHFYITPDNGWQADRIPSAVVALSCGLATSLMLERFRFFNRVKNNFSKLVYLNSTDSHPPAENGDLS